MVTHLENNFNTGFTRVKTLKMFVAYLHSHYIRGMHYYNGPCTTSISLVSLPFSAHAFESEGGEGECLDTITTFSCTAAGMLAVLRSFCMGCNSMV